MRIASWEFAAPCWALALVASWQMLGANAASADETLPAPGKVTPETVVVVQPGQTQGVPRLLYALDGGQMSISELRPGTMESEQLKTYLSMLHAPIDVQAAMADPTLVLVAMLDQQAGPAEAEGAQIQTAAAVIYSSEIMPRSYLAADGAWVFPRQPSADEREILGFHDWRVEENLESQRLFLGPDRRFGLDDFADLVNPLQHIPLVNVAYRAITGDKIYGAAKLLDVGFGPVAGVSTVFDLAVTDTTGTSMSDHAVAAVFGADDETATDDLAQVDAAPSDETPSDDAPAASNPLAYDSLAYGYNPMAASYYPESAQLPPAAPAPAQ